jgi:hypothetical protein
VILFKDESNRLSLNLIPINSISRLDKCFSNGNYENLKKEMKMFVTRNEFNQLEEDLKLLSDSFSKALKREFHNYDSLEEVERLRQEKECLRMLLLDWSGLLDSDIEVELNKLKDGER